MVTQTKQVTIKFTEEEFDRLENLRLAYITDNGCVINRTEFIKLAIGVKNEEKKDVR